MYVALLATGKAGGAFVPIDPQSPPDRIRYVIEDAGVDLLLTSTQFDSVIPSDLCLVVRIDAESDAIAASDATRPAPVEAPGDELAYVMYTSGTSGRPKGVLIPHSSICNFLATVSLVYDVRREDRVYQGMTLAFDFSIEEIWPTWAAGATIVAGPDGPNRLGAGLADFLEVQRVTVLYCVPTVLATIPREIPHIRQILVGGEACPLELVQRWAKSGRRMLNTYGPTETTVTATVAELLPGRPVTIGRPLPTYSVVLLDEDLRPAPDGAIGEIHIGGPGVALGYQGRPDLTADRFVAHPDRNERLYRTGDLGRFTDFGELEYCGRVDAQMKIRGHRLDPAEIESILLEDPQVCGAVVTTSADDSELIAYVTVADAELSGDVRNRLHRSMSQRLPRYLVPAYLEVVEDLPMLASGKVNRGLLPAPVGGRYAGTGPVVPPADADEARVAAVWAECLNMPVEAVSVTADFFHELGGHSLLTVRVAAAMRDGDVFPDTTVSDLHHHKTVRQLVAHHRRKDNYPAQTEHNVGAIADPPIIFIATCDLTGQMRGSAVPSSTPTSVVRRGIGWVPANLGLTSFHDIAAGCPFDSNGDLRLIPDTASAVSIPADGEIPGLKIYLADQTLPDGTPWDCCPRTFLRSALHDLRSQTGLRLVASFEQEFVLNGLAPSAPFSLHRHRIAEPFGTDLLNTLAHCGLRPESWQPEFGENQYEITLAPAEGLRAADHAILLRHIVQDLARRRGIYASFAPLQAVGATGSGVHVHFSLVDQNDQPVMYAPENPGRLSDIGSRFAAGILRHAPALTAWTAPSPVSFLRLVPHRWSAGGIFLGLQNREALLRICPTGPDEADAARQFNLEYRAADATANPWLTLGILVRAGLTGITRGYPAPHIWTKQPPLGRPDGAPPLPTSLDDALCALDHDDVVTSWFDPQLLACHIAVRRHELSAVSGLAEADQVSKIANLY